MEFLLFYRAYSSLDFVQGYLQVNVLLDVWINHSILSFCEDQPPTFFEGRPICEDLLFEEKLKVTFWFSWGDQWYWKQWKALWIVISLLSKEHLIESHTNRPDISFTIIRLMIKYLGSHVKRWSKYRFCSLILWTQQFSKSKITKFDNSLMFKNIS